MADCEWREHLKVGDEVATIRYGEPPEIKYVDHVTKLYVDVNGIRYRKDTGYPSGSNHGYRTPRLVQPTDGHREVIRRHGAIYALGRIEITTAIPTDRIEQAVAILKGEASE